MTEAGEIRETASAGSVSPPDSLATRLRAARRDATATGALREAVCGYVDAARARGERVEQVIISLKQEMRAAGVVDMYSDRAERTLAESVIRWCIERYYGSAGGTVPPAEPRSVTRRPLQGGRLSRGLD
jgi:hypothetical protein